MQALEEKKEVIVDATMHKLGRAASKIAKMLLDGINVTVVNAEKAIITGNKKAVLARYRFLISRKAHVSPERKTVWYPRSPDRIFRYAIYRMLPRHNRRWKEALKRLKVYVGVPEELGNAEKTAIPEAVLKDLRNRSGKLIRYMTLGELSRELRGVKA